MFFLLSCSPTKEVEYDNLTKNWKKDSLGCLNLRSKFYSDSINKKIIFKNKSESFITLYLGKSNKREVRGEYKYYIYYFNTKCNVNNRIIDSVDKCYLQYRINSKTRKVLDFQNICE